MATELKPQDDNENPLLSGSDGTTPNAPLNGSGSPAGPSNAPTTGSRFAGAASYLKANQGSNLGSQIANNISGQAQQANNSVNNASQSFNTAAQTGRNQADTNVISQVGTDPTNVNVDAYRKMATGNYQGPQTLDASAGGQVNNVNNLAQNTGNEQGRFGVLKSFYNKPGYSGGQQRLDNMLLQNDKSQRPALQQARQTAAATNNAYLNAQMDAHNQAEQYAREADQTRKDSQDALTKAHDDAIEKLKDQVTKAKQDQLTAHNAIAGQLDSGNITDMSLVGPTEDSITHRAIKSPLEGLQLLNGINMKDYLTGANTQFDNYDDGTLQKYVASPEQYAKMNALAKLAGQSDGDANFSDASLAGTYKDLGPRLDITKLLADNDAATSKLFHSYDDATSAPIKTLSSQFKDQGGYDRAKWLAQQVSDNGLRLNDGSVEQQMVNLYNASENAYKAQQGYLNGKTKTIHVAQPTTIDSRHIGSVRPNGVS